jgi:serine/threonine protein kinase
MHSRGILYLHLEPSNFFLNNHFGPTITGLYLAQCLDDDLDGDLILGTPLFLAPEVEAEYRHDFSVDVSATIGMIPCILRQPGTGNKLSLERGIPREISQDLESDCNPLIETVGHPHNLDAGTWLGMRNRKISKFKFELQNRSASLLTF